MGPGDNSWILWDFDGTLARRRDGWSACMARVLDASYPHLGITVDHVRPHFSTGFPWHDPATPHPHLDTPEAWWSSMDVHFDLVLRTLGCDDHVERGVLTEFRARYVDPREFELLADAEIVLASLARRGWRQLILSNHVPELASIVRALGIGRYLEAVISSASVGYEKPHPAAYAAAMDVACSPSRAWMIGDSLEADALGAARVGIASILVGGAPRRWRPATATLRGVVDLVGEP